MGYSTVQQHTATDGFGRHRVWIFLVVSLVFLISCDNKPLYLNVPYVTTPDFVVDRMLSVARVDSADYVIDLGSGDGRIVIAAAERGAVGHGVDIDPARVEEARVNAQNAGVSDRVLFFRENIFRTDFSQASVVTMFLLTTINEQLRPKLLEELRPGTRVVSHKFGMGDWAPDRHIALAGPSATTHEIFMWVIPAKASGTWNADIQSPEIILNIEQTFQNVHVQAMLDTDSLEVNHSNLRGKRLAFSGTLDNIRYQFSGNIENDTLSGYIQKHQPSGSTVELIQFLRNSDK
jgi:SAM-dependent methyltransferase